MQNLLVAKVSGGLSNLFFSSMAGTDEVGQLFGARKMLLLIESSCRSDRDSRGPDSVSWGMARTRCSSVSRGGLSRSGLERRDPSSSCG
jgi:hypothetical protein